MQKHGLFGSFIVLLLAITSTGCGWFQGNSDDPTIEEVTDLELVPTETHKQAVIPTVAEEKIELNLKVGDRFPLQKIVEQTVSQQAPQGIQTASSKLELQMVISVEEIHDRRKRLGVHFQSVRYSQNVAGQKQKYESDSTHTPTSTDLQAHLGMVNDGFYYWIGEDNQIIELVGFTDFLKRCIRNVPTEHRQELVAHLLENTDAEILASFIDDSIGLLEYKNADDPSKGVLKTGDEWTNQRRILRPNTLYFTNKCILKSLDRRTAEIEILGTISPSSTTEPLNQDMRADTITVLGGRTIGRCVIDRNSGLPVDSRIEHHLDMNVRLADGNEMAQHKHVVTTIRAVSSEQSPSDTDVRTTTTANPLHRAKRSKVVNTSHLDNGTPR